MAADPKLFVIPASYLDAIEKLRRKRLPSLAGPCGASGPMWECLAVLAQGRSHEGRN
jgi:hypothetical protein